MGFDWSKENNQNSSVPRSSSPLEPYLSLAHEESLQTQNQTLAHQKGWFDYRAAAGNQANVSAARQKNQTLESIRFPFQGAWGDYYVLWSDVEKNIDASSGMGRDNAAQFIVNYLKERDELDTLGGDPRGRRILVRLYDELTSGKVWEDERESADSIALVLKKSLDPKAYMRLLDPKAVPVIPLSADGLTHGSWVRAELLPSGKIFIKPSSSVEDWKYKKNYPDFFEWQGAEFDPHDILKVVLVDVSDIPQPILAVEFLAFANAKEYETLKKVIEATVAGATLPFSGGGLGGRTLFGGAASNSPKLARALTLTSGVSESSMTLARGISSTIEFADAAAIAWGGISFFVHSIEGGLIRRFGDDGKELLEWVHLLDRITLIYGFSRVVADVTDLINAISQRSKALRDVARHSAMVGGEDVEFAKLLEVIVDKTDELSAQQRQILQFNQQRFAGNASKSASAEVTPLLPDSTMSSVQHPAFEPPGSYKGGTKTSPQSADKGVPEAWLLDALSKGKAPPKTPPVPQELRVEAPASRTKGPNVPNTTNPKMEAASSFGSPRWYPMKQESVTAGTGAIKQVRVSMMDEDGALEVAIEQIIEPSLLRKGPSAVAPNFNQMLVRGSDIGLPEYRLAHLSGHGFGDEGLAGLWLAHDSINAVVQNNFIEKVVRSSARIFLDESTKTGESVRIFVSLRARRFGRSKLPKQFRAHDFLEHVEYEVSLLRGQAVKAEPIGSIKFSVLPPPHGTLIKRELEVTLDPINGHYLSDLFKL